jgi:hypothetical protein
MSVKQIVARLQEHTHIEAKNASEAGKALLFFEKLFGVQPKRAMYEGDAHGDSADGTVYFAPVMIGPAISRVTLKLIEHDQLELDIEVKGSGKVNNALKEIVNSNGHGKFAVGKTARGLVRAFGVSCVFAAKQYAKEQGYKGRDKGDDAYKTLMKWEKAHI